MFYMRKFSLAIALFYILITMNHVLAHGTVSRTTPADGSTVAVSPEKVQVWFDEPLQPNSGTIRVITSTGEQVEQGNVRYNPDDITQIEIALKPDLPAGVYIISASGVVVSDGDTATGSTLFWIEAKDTEQLPPPDYEILLVALGLLLLLGTISYWIFTRPSSLEINKADYLPLERR